MQLSTTLTKAKAKAKALLATRKGKAVAVAGGAVLVAGVVFLVRRNVTMTIPHYYGQAYDAAGDVEPWAGVELGFTTDRTTIGEAGCFLTAFAMAVEAFGIEDDFTPDVANDFVKDAGAFAGAGLNLEKAAAAVGLDAPDSERIHEGGGDVDEMRAVIDDALSKGGLCFVHVDKGHTGTGQHFILCHARQGGSYVCADAATGRDTLLDASTLSNDAVKWGSRNVSYNAVGVAPIYRGA